ncbi:MAG: DNA repair exonuclease [Alphaproteobacteria bacterium 32-64-14]|nr:MAG: DNA repair exonuclease [Alphaproteobacteria bacterium 32-64-14]
MAFKFIHTADWQIGKPFGNFPGDAGAELRLQRIKTVRKIAELAKQKAVDAVVVAGDAFDGNEVADRTIRQTIDALAPFAGPWVFLPGNHDPALAHSVWTRMRELDPPPNIIIADQPTPVMLSPGAAILPAPLRRRRESTDQTEWFDSADIPPGAVRVGLAHGSLANRLPASAESANEIREDRAARAGLDYLALGDWHGALNVAPGSWYSGSPETDRFRDNLSGQVLLVDIAGHRGAVDVKPVPVGHFLWRKIEVDIASLTSAAVLASLQSIAGDPGRCVVSLTVRGAISLAERVSLDRELRTWESRFHYLEVDTAGLVDEPTDDDLDAIDTSGFVRLAIGRLKDRLATPGDPQAAEARMALRMLYVDHVGQGEPS